MSLDITLINPTTKTHSGTGVFVREDGKNKELTPAEIERTWPGSSITEEYWETDEVWSTNITHNLNKMANEAGLYNYLWRPDESNWTHARQIAQGLVVGYNTLLSDPEHYKQFNPSNGWGTYEGLIATVREYIIACVTYPDARIRISR